MKNIQIVDGALNATLSVFQVTASEFQLIFPGPGQDIEFIEHLVARVGAEAAQEALTPVWERPILKRDAQGIHGTLYYDHAERAAYFPASKREIDRDPGSVNPAQRALFAAKEA
jgi:hypothetical protein